jgi:hypothetical protein
MVIRGTNAARAAYNVAVLLVVALSAMAGVTFIRPHWYKWSLIDREYGSAWSGMFAAVWGWDILGWLAAGLIARALLRTQRPAAWTLLMALAIGAAMWRSLRVYFGPSASLEIYVLTYGQILLPLTGVGLSNAIWLVIAKAKAVA